MFKRLKSYCTQKNKHFSVMGLSWDQVGPKLALSKNNVNSLKENKVQL